MISERAQAVEAAATLAMSRLAKAMQADGIDVINLGVGESDFLLVPITYRPLITR